MQVPYLAIDGLAYLEPAVDGWVDDHRHPLPQWLDVTMPRPERIGRVAIYTVQVAECEIRLLCEGEWVTVGVLHPERYKTDVEHNVLLPTTLVLDEPRVATAVRVVVTQSYENKDNPYVEIAEVEAYRP
jgi:hypothetical protein